MRKMAEGRADISELDWLGRIVSGGSPPAASMACSQRKRSATAQEQLVQLVHAQLRPGRAAMVALPAALGVLHVAQQGIHLRQRQSPIGTHSAVAGHGRQQLVEMRLNAVTGAVLQQIREHVTHQLGGLRLL